MIALQIEDLKQFTKKLFLQETFDNFLVKEVNIVTYNSFTIDGHIRHGFYSAEELEENRIEELSAWRALRPFCFSIIKGNKLPLSFSIVLLLAPANVEKVLKQNGLSLNAADVNGLYINIRYENGRLNCITGTSLNLFTLDKTLDQIWDQMVKLFLKQNEIPCQEA